MVNLVRVRKWFDDDSKASYKAMLDWEESERSRLLEASKNVTEETPTVWTIEMWSNCTLAIIASALGVTTEAGKEGSNMEYSEDFKRRCRDLFPMWADLSKDLDSGSVMVGTYLEESRAYGVSEKLARERPDDARVVAERSMAISALYEEWVDLYQAQIPIMPFVPHP